MKPEEKIAAIIPTYNSRGYLELLIRKLADFSGLIDEIVVVNDGSTDSTSVYLGELRETWASDVVLRLVENPTNKGRYESRLVGAKSTDCSHLIFCDVRLDVSFENIKSIRKLLEQWCCLMPMIAIDEFRSIYSLYWKRTHQWLFPKNYVFDGEGLVINLENFERYTKGTGGLVCLKSDFLGACESMQGGHVLSDDIFLLKFLAEKRGVFVSPTYTIDWEPRQNLLEFAMRMFERGPGFVEYNLVNVRSRFFRIFFIGLLLVCSFYFLLVWFGQGFWFSILLLGSLLFSVLLWQAFSFCKTLQEFARLLPLHVVVVGMLSLGIGWGVLVQLRLLPRIRPIGSRPAPSSLSNQK